jgi:hypothetical protein
MWSAMDVQTGLTWSMRSHDIHPLHPVFIVLAMDIHMEYAEWRGRRIQDGDESRRWIHGYMIDKQTDLTWSMLSGEDDE